MLRRWFRAGAVAGLLALSLGASATLGDDHRRGLAAYHRGDVVGAISALRGAAKAGHAPSQVLLGFILESADIVDEAAQLYRDAAAQNDADGHAGLANLILAGRGVAKDEKQALVHFSKAAELGHTGSMEVLVRVYQRGLYGVMPDLAQAAAWQARIAATPKPVAKATP